ncbi:hypothetical protein CYMTET_10352 [Cymbomonas tetramitiformis]|uniref:Uncharacterized protein n=1 Tax=Cymbomonas tetramitiformis TaxID=36881 RepID=A0AAE0GPV1_9CHLO|nr:hypothetical protein CYMTET_10352 [Cymbomonas tetramitiformis]
MDDRLSTASPPSPSGDRENWRQDHYKKDSAHNISFHVTSSAFIPDECVRCRPGRYHDTANCPTDDVACEECDLTAADENDRLVSAVQTAFDAAFAKLYAQHDQPVAHHGEDPFTRRGTSLRQLKQAAGGAGEVQHFHMLHFDSATTVENDTMKHDTVER